MVERRDMRVWWFAMVLGAALSGSACGDEGNPAQDGAAGASVTEPVGSEPDGAGADTMSDPGTGEGATETNVAAAPCDDDADCSQSRCGPPVEDGSRFCAPPDAVPAGSDEDAGL